MRRGFKGLGVWDGKGACPAYLTSCVTRRNASAVAATATASQSHRRDRASSAATSAAVKAPRVM